MEPRRSDPGKLVGAMRKKPIKVRGLDGKLYPINRKAVKRATDEMIPYSTALQQLAKK